MTFRFSCSHTSQQNGKDERMITTLNNGVRSLLFQAQLSPTYWAEALHVACHILNILPLKAMDNKMPHSILYGNTPTYDHLKVFGCLCFPNVSHSTTKNLAPRSTPCLFLGSPLLHRGYRCLDLKINRIIISRHVVLDECTFPAAQKLNTNKNAYGFLEKMETPSSIFRSILEMSHSLPSPAISTFLVNTALATTTCTQAPTKKCSSSHSHDHSRSSRNCQKKKNLCSLPLPLSSQPDTKKP